MGGLWVIIPAYNEGSRIKEVIKAVSKHSKNVVVVDDGSSDNTYEIASMHDVTILKHIVNMGKGAALKTGCDFAFRNGAEIMIVVDADGQHQPDDIPRFMDEIKKGNKVVFGYREGLEKMPSILRLGNEFITLMIRWLYGLTLRDTQCGYRAFTASAYRNIRWKASDYSMESEMIANLGKNKMPYSEMPIPTIYHDTYKGTTVKDGIKIVINLIMWRFTR